MIVLGERLNPELISRVKERRKAVKEKNIAKKVLCAKKLRILVICNKSIAEESNEHIFKYLSCVRI